MDNEKGRLAMNMFLKLYFRTSREVYKEINFGEITGKQFKYLRTIHDEGEINYSRFAEIFCLSKPTVTEIMTKFLETGLVEKKQSEEDARVFLISLTDRGKQLAMTNELESRRTFEKLKEMFSQDELESLVALFEIIGEKMGENEK